MIIVTMCFLSFRCCEEKICIILEISKDIKRIFHLQVYFKSLKVFDIQQKIFSISILKQVFSDNI